MTTTTSKNGVVIRLPDERWTHIIEEHGELADLKSAGLDTIADPERILVGNSGEHLALRAIESGKRLIVIYRELESDGFIITAFLTRRTGWIEKKRQIWP